MPFRPARQRGRAVTHVHDDAIVGDPASRAAARTAGLPWLRGGLVEHGRGIAADRGGQGLPLGAERHTQLMADSPMRDRLWAFIMQGEDLPYPTNRVDLDPTVRDVRGASRWPGSPTGGGRHELAASDHHGPRLEAVLKEMGAGWTTSPPRRGPATHGARPAVPESRHVMGTARMGTTRRHRWSTPRAGSTGWRT